ncbi:VaFE repeat-containing surface-anchored protein, partial [Corynebacterium tuberculostearicum]
AGAKIVDKVSYEGLVPGKEYSLDAQLISKDDGKSVLGETKGHTFVPENANGTEAVTITVNDDVKEPVEAAVAFETLTSKVVNDKGEDTPDNDKPNEIGEHKDINDDDQTVTKKKNAIVSTNADFENGSKEVVAGAKIVDKVSYEGLVPGKEYSLDAQLISKDDGKSVLGETKGHTFVPENAKGTEAVTITVNDDVKEPVEAAVAFETLTSKVVNDKPNEIGEHKDINDDDQTVTSEDEPETSTPETTTSTEEVPGKPGDGGEGETSEQSSSEDSSTSTTSETCESEEPGDSESEQPSGSEEPSESESSEPSESESVETTSSEASETSESDEPSDCGSTTPEKPAEPSEPTDPNEPGTPGTPGDNDEKDTPKVSTNADFEGGLREVVAGAKIVDEVTYEGLVPGKEYTLKAELISKKDGKTVLGEGEATFTPDESKGMEPVTITVNDDVKEPVEAAVAFEELTSTEVDKNGEDKPADSKTPNEIADHKDINDKDQTVTSEEGPKVSTNADFEGGLREVVAGAKIVDQVSYEGLVPGKQYTLDAQLISKEDGKTVLGETKGHTFVPESANGTEAVTIVVDEKVTEPVEAAVAFETLTSTQVDKHGEEKPTDKDNPNHVGEHKDINDKDQTVPKESSEKTPKITTNADFEKGSHEVIAGAKIVDDVTYEGLVPGKEYTLKAELINKKDGKSVLGTGEKTFTPEKSKGMVPVTITVNDDVKEPVQAAVAFEELTSTEVNDKGEETPGTTPEKPNHIAEHKDINDDDQTVISHEVHDQDKPGGSSDGSSNGSSNGSSDGSSNGSSKDNKWWLILIPGIGLGKIIKDHFDHKDHGNHNGGHGDNTGNHDGGNGKHTDGHKGGNGHEVKGQDAPKGGNADNGHGRGVEVQGQEPEETGNALPSNAERVEIKSVPSGATELEPGMQDYIK